MGFRSRACSALLAFCLFTAVQPARAGSSLSAWRISRDGTLELRTQPGVAVQAFYEEGIGWRGPRIWVDLPGAPIRPRTIPGRGPLREVRIGRPNGGTTRLVLEFQQGTRLDPRQIRLVGTARDRWRMELVGLPAGSLWTIGEGDVEASPRWSARPGWSMGDSAGTSFGNRPTTSRLPLSSEGLPSVPRGRFRVVIDPGHGGPDPGAVGIGGLRETDVVLDVGLQVAQLLQAQGVQVLMTRTSEVDVDLPPRVALANSSRSDVFVSLHANALSMSRPDVNGVETFYFEGGRSRSLASLIQEQLMAVSPGTPDRGARPGRFFVIRRTVMPSALAEMGFVTGSLDAPRLADANFRRRLAQAVAGAILTYLNSL
ncbi:MAG: N-acetylmuramoyl-L-alanine amidase [Synechococcaceae cyanobacterium]|nr:N-acetylmuramoyl-L-alanine amidase [Synechococcaceae cyanobacterium]